jgi:hypothetical protein
MLIWAGRDAVRSPTCRTSINAGPMPRSLRTASAMTIAGSSTLDSRPSWLPLITTRYCSRASPSGASIPSTHANPCRLRRVQATERSPFGSRCAVRLTGDGGRNASPSNCVDAIAPPSAEALIVAPRLQIGRMIACKVPGRIRQNRSPTSCAAQAHSVPPRPRSNLLNLNRPSPRESTFPNWKISLPSKARFSPAARASSLQLVMLMAFALGPDCRLKRPLPELRRSRRQPLFGSSSTATVAATWMNSSARSAMMSRVDSTLA